MEPDEILKKAWDAVKASGVPESMYDTAFREAVAILRGDEGAGGSAGAPGAKGSPRKKPPARTQPTRKKAARPAAASASVPVPDGDTFFADLAEESGVAEKDLRDLLQLSPDGTVTVTPATRTLGGNKAEQARTVVPLVAGARRFGMNENPVSADAVRRECARKNCMDSGNFAATVIDRLAGFNYGRTNAEIVATSKWVNDFTAAVNRAHGRTATGAKDKEK
jgi:hypothetical protein